MTSMDPLGPINGPIVGPLTPVGKICSFYHKLMLSRWCDVIYGYPKIKLAQRRMHFRNLHFLLLDQICRPKKMLPCCQTKRKCCHVAKRKENVAMLPNENWYFLKTLEIQCVLLSWTSLTLVECFKARDYSWANLIKRLGAF